MEITAVLEAESAAGLMESETPFPTPGSVSKKYSREVIGPAFELLTGTMKKVLDSVGL
jgi:hypothetical protein